MNQEMQARFDEVARLIDRSVAKKKGRAATIRRLWATIQELLRDRETARRWLRGEFADQDASDPMTGKPWCCMWCGGMILGGRKEAAAHVQECEANPLVQRIRELERTAHDCAGDKAMP